MYKVKSEPAHTPDKDGKFSCHSCSKEFTKGVSLGGHVSKVHPGGSVKYQNKMKVYASRKFDRDCLVIAKSIYKIYYKGVEMHEDSKQS